MSTSPAVRLSALAAQRWGLFTTAQAGQVGVHRNQLSRMTAAGILERVIHGVYRFAGAPAPDNELTYATWLALGGANYAPGRVPPVVAGGVTAASLHEIGDFYPDGYDFLVPERKGTRLAGTRLRIRRLAVDDITFVDQLPVLTIERTIADLVEQWTDLSLVADATRDAIQSGKLVSPRKLVEYLAPLAAAHGYDRDDGAGFAAAVFELAGIEPVGTYR